MAAPLLPVIARIPVGAAGDYVLDLAAASDGAALVAATSGGAVVAIDATAAGGGSAPPTRLVGRHGGAVTACVLEGTTMMTSSLDGTVAVWDARADGGAGPAQR